MLTAEHLKANPADRDAAVDRYHAVIGRKPEQLRARVIEACDAVEARRRELFEAERSLAAAAEPFHRGTALTGIKLPAGLDHDARKAAVQSVVDAEGKIEDSVERRIAELTQRVEAAKAHLVRAQAELTELDQRQKDAAQLRESCRKFLRDAGVAPWEVK